MEVDEGGFLVRRPGYAEFPEAGARGEEGARVVAERGGVAVFEEAEGEEEGEEGEEVERVGAQEGEGGSDAGSSCLLTVDLHC